jgi:murein DD-endopeptidase MepM/ murein hydrolase activator NlpD
VASVPTPARPSGWTILVVPKTPDKRTRAFRLRKRYLKLAGALIGLFLFAVAGILVLESLDQDETLDELADAQWVIQALSDSLHRASASTGGGIMQAGAPLADAAPKSAPLSTMRRPATRARRRADMGLAAPAPGVVLPVMGRISSRFTTSRFHPLLHIFRPHLGVDISAPAGTNISAPAPGRVSFVGRKFGEGLTVDIDHGDGIVSRYGHCKKILVHEGEMVTPGTVIATVGSSGLSTGPHVHFEVRLHNKPIDPLSFILPRDSTFTVGGHARNEIPEQLLQPQHEEQHPPSPSPDSTTPTPAPAPNTAPRSPNR